MIVSQTLYPTYSIGTFDVLTMNKSITATASNTIPSFNFTSVDQTVNNINTSFFFTVITMNKSGMITVTPSCSWNQAVSLIHNQTLDCDIASVVIAEIGKPFIFSEKDNDEPIVTYDRDASLPIVFYSRSYGFDKFIHNRLKIISSMNRYTRAGNESLINPIRNIQAINMNKSAPTVYSMSAAFNTSVF